MSADRLLIRSLIEQSDMLAALIFADPVGRATVLDNLEDTNARLTVKDACELIGITGRRFAEGSGMRLMLLGWSARLNVDAFHGRGQQ